MKFLKMHRSVAAALLLAVTLAVYLLSLGAAAKGDYIKYAEFNVCYNALQKAVDTDIETYGEDIHISCIEVLAYLGAKYGGDFSGYKSADMNEFIEKLKSGKTADELCRDMKYYGYYKEVYSAVLSGFLGEFTEDGERRYGLRVYSPIADGFYYSDYDDFGAGRSYGYKRRHLGHDMLAATGTPVIAVEEGTVECMGWNQYGGWRIGIRSLDKKRYYYYAHLRQNRPFHPDIQVGKTVEAGSVIGYVGRTGYSAVQNTNGIEESHLHWGLELIFDESQKESDNEIWVDLYAVTRLLSSRRSKVYRVAQTKEFYKEGD